MSHLSTESFSLKKLHLHTPSQSSKKLISPSNSFKSINAKAFAKSPKPLLHSAGTKGSGSAVLEEAPLPECFQKKLARKPEQKSGVNISTYQSI